jgi:histidinol-phosphate aminotransferase
VVIRSLTKTWGLAGLRVGYVIASAGIIEQLGAVQPHWPVSTPALAAAIACSNEQALTEAAQAALDIDRQRAYLLDALAPTQYGDTSAAPATTPYGDTSAAPGTASYGGTSVGRGVVTYGVARGPCVLVRVEGAAVLREALRERGYAVRRGDTFPGLGPDWLRIAVRPEEVTDGFVKVWRDLLS